jgi:uncharacterized protein YfeS
MERIALAEQLLKYMVIENKEKERECFKFEELKSLFRDHDHSVLNNALSLLKNDGFILLQSKNDASNAVLRSQAISHISQEAMMRKSYSTLKEIKDMLS